MIPALHAARFPELKPKSVSLTKQPVRLTVVKDIVSLTPKRKRGAAGSFDRVKYQREYMRRRRAKAKTL